jgi:hypothetical protein
MKDDKEIRDFFHAQRPKVGGEEAFLARLNERLVVADQVKGYCRQERRRSRRGVVIAGIIGLLCGIGLVLMLIYLPAYLPEASTVWANTAENVRMAAREGFADAAANANFDYLRFGLLIRWRYFILAALALGVIVPTGYAVVRKITE